MSFKATDIEKDEIYHIEDAGGLVFHKKKKNYGPNGTFLETSCVKDVSYISLLLGIARDASDFDITKVKGGLIVNHGYIGCDDLEEILSPRQYDLMMKALAKKYNFSYKKK